VSDLSPTTSNPLDSSTSLPPAGIDPYAVTRRTLDLSRPDGRDGFAAWRDDEPERGGAFRQLLAMLARRRKVILATIATVLLATLLFLMLSPSVYQAITTMQVHTTPVVAGNDDDNNLPVLADLSGVTQSRSLETQLAILRSKPVQQGAIKRLSPNARAIAQKYHDINIEAVGDTDLINITARTSDKYAAAAISNGFAKEYIQLSRSKNRNQLQDATDYAERQLRTTEQSLARARDALRTYKQRNGAFDLPTQTQNLLTEIGQIEAEWREARANKASAQAEYNKLRAAVAQMPSTSVVPQEIVRSPAVTALRAQLTKLEIDRFQALEEYQPTRPEVRAIEGQIAALRSRLQREAQTEVGSWVREVNPVRQNLTQDVARLQGQVWAAEARGTALKAASIRARSQLSGLPEREQRLGILTGAVTSLEQTQKMLNDRYQGLRMTQDARVANASILFSAQEGELVSNSKTRSLLFALLLSLPLALGLAALLDWLDDRVYSEQDAKVVSRLPVLAQIPYLDNPEQQSLLQGTWETPPLNGGAQSTAIQGIPDNPALLENFRMARTSLALASGSKPISSVVVTSSLANEGKSMTSMNLAIAAAMSGERVIIVDCDLRRPSVHRLMQLPNEVGFSSVVQGTHPLSQALQDTRVPNLRALTSGPLVMNSFQMLNSPAARACLQQVLELADFVVVDSPPALVLADAQILSTMTDATLLVISTQEANRREVVRTRDLLSHSGSRPVGVILNKVVPIATARYDQYSYYGINGGQGNLSRRFS
jgi:capsular exopolysaccharide synthesis family protein